MNQNILLVTNMPTPYRIPLFNEINSQLQREGFKLIVVFGVGGESRRQWNINYSDFEFEYKLLSGDGIKRKNAETISLYYGGLIRLLIKSAPVCVITPGFSIATLKVFLTSLILNIKYVIWSGEIDLSSKRKSFNHKFIKLLLTKRASKFITYGSLSKKYIESLGVSRDKIDISLNTVDTNFFYEASSRGECINTNQFIYVGNLTQGKRVDLIIKAVSKLKAQGQDILVLIIGDGPMKSELETMSKNLSLSSNIKFLGFLQKDELPKHFSESVCMLFPSEYDIWGLVLCEAMACGIPCISSIRSGATHDLIEDGVNGFAVDFEDTNDLVEKMLWMITEKSSAETMGLKAQQFMLIVASIKESAAAFSKSILSVVKCAK